MTRYTVSIASSFLRLVLVVCMAIQVSVPVAQPRDTISLRTGWKFYRGHEDRAHEKGFDDSRWQEVKVPHDWAIAGPFIPEGDGNTGKLPWKGEGWYRLKTGVPARWEGRRIYLVFDGVMAFPKVYVNGSLAGSWDYGYNSFYLDVTSFLQPGTTNLIAVHADTRAHDSRWYPGAGIYRKVQMIAVHPVHIPVWGNQVTTPIIKPHYARVQARTPVINTSITDMERLEVDHIIVSPAGKILQTTTNQGRLQAGDTGMFESTLILPDPQRWDIGHGVLYQLRTVVRSGDVVIDAETTAFGVRSIRFTPDDGFYLNDRRVPLKGVNLHHDHGPLGAAFYTRAMERQLELLTSMGCNAIRTSHNVPAPELLELCDKMGILVLDELFDKYDRKADILEETDFTEFAERNVRNFIQRDRNHPSVFLWSVGNEIGDVQWNIDGGFAKLLTMIHEVRRYDASRPVTLVCDSRNSAALRHFDFYDVHAWNYGRRYDLARQLEPNKAVIISESASTVSTRGFYEWPLPVKKTDFTSSLQVSSYDLHAPEWAEIADDDFMWQQEENYIAGEFVWTGFDYLGEPTPYTNDAVKKMGMTDKDASVSSYFGIFDLVGIPKDRYYLYKSYWRQDETTVHILPHWNWHGREGEKMPVFVYTNGDCAELFLNGRSLGMHCKKPTSSNSTERFRLMWLDVTYEPGELRAIAYKEGEKIGEAGMKTSGAAHVLRLTPDRKVIKADGCDLSYVLVEAVDQHGQFCPLADHLIEVSLIGEGAIAGVGNGDPQSMASFQSSQVKLFYGKAMIILRSTDRPGKIQLTVSSKELMPDTAEIRSE